LLTQGGMVGLNVSAQPHDVAQDCRDVCLIVVGCGRDARELARRRCAAHGRLLVLWTGTPPAGSYQPSKFTWCPPPTSLSEPWTSRIVSCTPRADILREVVYDCAGERPRKWCKRGADVVLLDKTHTYQIAEANGENSLSGLRVLQGGKVIWEITGCVTIVGPGCDVERVPVGVQNQYAMPIPLHTNTGIVCWTLYFAIVCILALHAESSDFNTYRGLPFWRSPLWVGYGPFGYHYVNDMVSPSACGRYVGRTCRVLAAVLWVGLCVTLATLPARPDRFLTYFWVAGIGTGLYCAVGVPVHLVLVGRLPAYWRWTCLFVLCTLGSWFIFYGLCAVFVALGRKFPAVAAILMPIAVSSTEGLTVRVLAYGYRHYAYKANASGDQSTILTCALSLIHAFSEGARLAVVIMNTVRTNTYMWVLSIICSLLLNLATRMGWTRLAVMRLLHLVKSGSWHILRPSMCTLVHTQAKFQLGYVRFTAPLAIGFVRGILKGRSPLSNSSAVLAVGFVFMFELVEDLIVWNEWLPYAKPCDHFPEYYTWYRNIGRFDPLQSYTITSKPHSGTSFDDVQASSLSVEPAPEEVVSRPLPLHGARRLSFTMHVIAVAPAALFILCALQLFLGAGYVSGRCESPLDDILSQAFLVAMHAPC
ncbi:unnamed protein product, partial [Prorocentrum cordatum]